MMTAEVTLHARTVGVPGCPGVTAATTLVGSYFGSGQGPATRQGMRTLGLGGGRLPKMAYVLFFCLVVSSLMPAFAGSDFDDQRIVSALLERARAGENPVRLTFLADKVCVFPEGGIWEPSVRIVFPEAKTISPEFIDKSEGVWFIAFEATGQKDEVRLFEIDQQKLRWMVDESRIYRDLIVCPVKVEIDLGANVPTVKQFLFK